MPRSFAAILLAALFLLTAFHPRLSRQGGYYYVYTAAYCKLTPNGQSQKVCFISEIFQRESQAEAEKLRTRLQDDIQTLYPDISPLPTAIPSPIRYESYGRADDARSKTAATFTRQDNKIVWVKRP